MFVTKWKQRAIEAEATAAVYAAAHNKLLRQWNALIRRINKLCGEQLFADAERKAASSVFTQQEINFLLRLAHPDRHSGNEVATQKLLTMRSRHAP